MKVVLRTDVDGLGYKGDIVSISDGYAQNKLIPQGLAYLATAGAEKEAEGDEFMLMVFETPFEGKIPCRLHDS